MIFQLVQKNLSVLGITKTQSVRVFRIKVLIGGFLLGIHIIIHLKFFFGEANSFSEYSESTFLSSVSVVAMWCYANLIHEREKILEFIEEIEKLLLLFDESKFTVICGIRMFFSHDLFLVALNDEYPSAVTGIFKAAKLADQCGEIMYLAIAQATPLCLILPRFLYCLYRYYVEGLGRDSFEGVDRTAWY